MSDFKDFDEAYEEISQKTLDFKVAGKQYSVSAQLPASVVLNQISALDATGRVDSSKIGEFLASILGEEILDDMLANKVSWKQLEEILNWLMIEYNVVPDPNAEPVEDDGDDNPK